MFTQLDKFFLRQAPLRGLSCFASKNKCIYLYNNENINYREKLYCSPNLNMILPQKKLYKYD